MKELTYSELTVIVSLLKNFITKERTTIIDVRVGLGAFDKFYEELDKRSIKKERTP